jgi:hypothetical protein
MPAVSNVERSIACGEPVERSWPFIAPCPACRKPKILLQQSRQNCRSLNPLPYLQLRPQRNQCLENMYTTSNLIYFGEQKQGLAHLILREKRD